MADTFSPTPSRQALDYALSIKVAELIQAQPNTCWYSARDALLQLPGLFWQDWCVDGWMVEPTQEEIWVVEHGWIECRDGRIVDPSRVLLVGEEQALYYFPGLRYPRSLLQEVPQDISLPLARFVSRRDDGMDLPDYKASFEAARAYAEHVAQATGKTVQVHRRETMMAIVSKDVALIFIFEE